MIIRSKAPLRLGLAGGGSDVSPYCDLYGGLVLNATINLYAHCTIEPLHEDIIEFNATDLEEIQKCQRARRLEIDGKFSLHKGVYNKIVEKYKIDIPPFKITTYSDAPPGSGLGSSSTMVVAILTAFSEWFKLPLGEYDIAKLAYEIEREDLGLSGGKQDQYAATFGGFNFMEFGGNGTVIVNPLRVKRWIIDELECSMVLYYTGASRSSAQIIDEQKKNAEDGIEEAVKATHKLKASASEMKSAILMGDIFSFSRLIGSGWEAKKKMAKSISNKSIEDIFELALSSGAISGKISGAGGGGYIMFVVEPTQKMSLIKALSTLPGQVMPFQFVEVGSIGWTIY